MEADLLKPFIAKFKLRRRIRRLEYEGLHLVCFGYGLYGLLKDSCPVEKHETSVAPEPTTEEEPNQKPIRKEESEPKGVEKAISPEVTDA